MSIFAGSYVFTAVSGALAAWWGYNHPLADAGAVQSALAALFTALVLGAMEVSLSFDNAVVNAKVLEDMNEKWQKVFLTWGVLIAVFGMRLVFPILIVSMTGGQSMREVLDLALHNPDLYSAELAKSHVAISSFGGMFLLLVFFSFIFEEKEIYWLSKLEKLLAKIGQLKSAEILFGLVTLGLCYKIAPEPERMTALLAGLAGVITYGMVGGLADVMENLGAEEETAQAAAGAVKKAGAMTFLYLEVLDASFSFDGVIGAFAITKDVVLIMLGLGIGAMFVRSLTVFLVRKGTLSEYVYLEHGAHYAIGALAAIMLYSLNNHVSELVTGGIGIALILLSLGSSILDRNKAEAGGTSENGSD